MDFAREFPRILCTVALRIAELQELGFDYSIAWRQVPTSGQKDAFPGKFLGEVIDPRGLCLDGDCTEGAITGKIKNPTEHDQEAVRAWLSAWSGITHRTPKPSATENGETSIPISTLALYMKHEQLDASRLKEWVHDDGWQLVYRDAKWAWDSSWEMFICIVSCSCWHTS